MTIKVRVRTKEGAREEGGQERERGGRQEREKESEIVINKRMDYRRKGIWL